jgi:Fe-S cluster assembly protein SufD
MAGLPNSSNALQQWHHLFEAQGGRRRLKPAASAADAAPGCRRVNMKTGNTPRWMPERPFVAAGTFTATQRDALALPMDAWRLVFVDGQFSELSDDLAASGYDVRWRRSSASA